MINDGKPVLFANVILGGETLLLPITGIYCRYKYKPSGLVDYILTGGAAYNGEIHIVTTTINTTDQMLDSVWTTTAQRGS